MQELLVLGEVGHQLRQGLLDNSSVFALTAADECGELASHVHMAFHVIKLSSEFGHLGD